MRSVTSQINEYDDDDVDDDDDDDDDESRQRLKNFIDHYSGPSRYRYRYLLTFLRLKSRIT